MYDTPRGNSVNSPTPLATECPRCGSRTRSLHPATAVEGEVQPCPNPWHFELDPSNRCLAHYRSFPCPDCTKLTSLLVTQKQAEHVPVPETSIFVAECCGCSCWVCRAGHQNNPLPHTTPCRERFEARQEQAAQDHSKGAGAAFEPGLVTDGPDLVEAGTEASNPTSPLRGFLQNIHMEIPAPPDLDYWPEPRVALEYELNLTLAFKTTDRDAGRLVERVLRWVKLRFPEVRVVPTNSHNQFGVHEVSPGLGNRSPYPADRGSSESIDLPGLRGERPGANNGLLPGSPHLGRPLG